MAAPLLSTQQIRHFTAPVHLRVATRVDTVKCKAKADTSSNSSVKIQRKHRTESNNVVLKIAWYASELYGMAAAVLQPHRPTTVPVVEYQKLTGYASGSVDRAAVVAAIVQDFLSSYVVSGNATAGAYEEECEFIDPIHSFKGLRRFKRNCTNFGFLVLKSNLKFTKWEDFEDKGIAHWEFSFVMSLPWTPVLSTTGCTEFHFDAESGKVCRHIEKRDVPIMLLFKQIFVPSRYNDRKGQKGKSKFTVEVATEMAARAVTKCN